MKSFSYCIILKVIFQGENQFKVVLPPSADKQRQSWKLFAGSSSVDVQLLRYLRESYHIHLGKAAVIISIPGRKGCMQTNDYTPNGRTMIYKLSNCIVALGK